ncbi:FAD binding domain protein [Colletotrichum karsti]|uniref:FAD binding domain protein n=1 Tax=Colletotrichum karsti TaxID=1095194 RepID=A0A9P6LKD2_9PEZI|nr:FAD binding domain protein [Colletotrichum karsti]KAF9876628.1 FAD binding domain protein [Colletotrichum karsti]
MTTRSILVADLSLASLVSSRTAGNVAPTLEKVPSDSAASGIDYFDFETLQLTIEVIDTLSKSNFSAVNLFDFGNEDAKEIERTCKVFPGDAAWTSDSTWFYFDRLTGGALVDGVPPAAPCYEDWPQFDEAKCEEITSKWSSPQFQMSAPTGLDFPLYEGVSCIPPNVARPGAECTQGGNPSYVVNVTNVAQIQLAVNFARNLNLRLNVKNKGHDFNGKSTGAGALSVWTHHLQDIRYLGPNYTHAVSGYTGPALKIGSGVTMLDFYEAADKEGLQVVGGIARTIGIGGGYIAGGGNGPLMSAYGTGADQVLSMEVILPNGRFVSVDEQNYPDLFFALRGGGGSTWGIVTSLVVRAYPKTPITSLSYSFSTANVSVDKFWSGVDAVFAVFPEYADAGMFSHWSLTCAGATDCNFSMLPQLGIDMNAEKLKAVSAPLFANLSTLQVPVSGIKYTELNGVRDAVLNTWGPEGESAGGWGFHTASRLFPRSNWEDPEKLAAQTSALRQSAEKAGYVLGYNIKTGANPSVNQTNAVNPAFRETLMHVMLGATWGQEATPEDIAAASKNLVELLQPWREASPGAGTYLNEADINEPDWQQAFYGSNYEYLYQLKQKYDPWGVLYAATAVGSEDWYITDQIDYYPTQNGRLCPK